MPWKPTQISDHAGTRGEIKGGGRRAIIWTGHLTQIAQRTDELWETQLEANYNNEYVYR